MVEMVIVVPLLVILLFSIIQMGIALNRVQAYHAAAREGARVGSLQGGTTGQISNAANSTLVGITGPAPAVAVPTGTCGSVGQTITVTVSSPYVIQIPLIPDIPITLTGSGSFRCEG